MGNQRQGKEKSGGKPAFLTLRLPSGSDDLTLKAVQAGSENQDEQLRVGKVDLPPLFAPSGFPRNQQQSMCAKVERLFC